MSVHSVIDSDSGVRIRLEGAGVFTRAPMARRLAARTVDLVVVGLPAFVSAELLLGSHPTAKSLLVVAVSFVYEVVMTATRGATFGKKVAGLRVVTIRSVAAGRRGIGRTALLRASVTSFPNFVTFGLWGIVIGVSPFLDRLNRQGFHDRAAKTYVVRDE